MYNVKLFDESHEIDLEKKINEFLKSNVYKQIYDIKFQTSIMYDSRDQIFCFSAMIIFETA